MSAVDPQAVDVARLEVDPAYRVAYLTAVVGLTEVDRALIRASRPHLTPWLDALMVAIEGRLLGFSNTARHFDGLPPAMVTVHLRAYVDAILRPRDEAQLAAYLDHVARAHGPDGGDPRIVVPLVEVSGLLAFITDQVIGAVAELDLPVERRFAAARAWSKLLWIQADLFHWDAARQTRA